MTLPITFTATPKAVDPPPDRANMPLHYESVASTTLTNFEKVNTVLRGWSTPNMAQSTCGVMPTTPVTPAVWTDFSAAFWPPINVAIPPGCGALIVGLGARVKCTSSDINQQLHVSLRLSGATTAAPNRSYHRILPVYGEIATSIALVVPKASLTVGGTVTITPQFFRQTVGDMTYAGVDGGNLWAIALR
jgi:hypothetical protein